MSYGNIDFEFPAPSLFSGIVFYMRNHSFMDDSFSPAYKTIIYHATAIVAFLIPKKSGEIQNIHNTLSSGLVTCSFTTI